MGKKYIDLDAIVKDITTGKIEITGDPYAKACVEAYRDVLLKRLSTEPTVELTPVTAIYEAEKDLIPKDGDAASAWMGHVTDSLLSELLEAERGYVTVDQIDDPTRRKTKYRAFIIVAQPESPSVKPGERP